MVSYPDQRLIRHCGEHRCQQLALCARIKADSRLIQNYGWSILQQYAGQGNPLAFPAGETLSGLTHRCIVTFRQRGDQVIQLSQLSGLLNLFI
ncbi:hypothetical protein D3C75_1008740 [compost metagenome]